MSMAKYRATRYGGCVVSSAERLAAKVNFLVLRVVELVHGAFA